MSEKRAVVLLSGGIDSTTTLALAKREGYRVYALSFRYGQRNRFELDAAKRVAKALGVEEHLIIDIDLRLIGGSALTGAIEVPKGRTAQEIGKGIPVTYVPARNTIFLSFGLAWSEVLMAQDIFIGVNSIDYSGYPDCREEYIRAFEEMANLALKETVEGKIRIKIRTPLIRMRKSEIIKKGLELGVDYGMTISCYDPLPDGKPCGLCDSCILRKKGFEELGIPDPAYSG
ncbi:MAG: 7-cyano-7-deazaguanine synthase QueC [Deltaproteobacteria bacterium]|nr:MAG: 7-cyano-7-deazaguanine synthase QueC [Deltaproteobacteria bacterium]